MTLLQIHEPGETPAPHEGEDQAPAIGIDLGTTHSIVALTVNGQPHVVRNPQGHTIVPSIVAYDDNNEVLVGHEALGHPHAIHSVKRLMHDASQQLETGAAPRTPVEVSAVILSHMRALAEDALDCEVNKAVITVPAYFDDAARTATRDAARLAGLEVLRLINEPTAAALAYGLDSGAEGIYAIYDLGGGTFDISILKLEKGVFQVLATGGDTHLGGDDFDAVIAEKLDVNRHQARTIKEQLSNVKEVDGLAREAFNSLAAPLVKCTLTICDQALRDAGLDASELKGVVLVGGSTRMPIIREQVEKHFGVTPLTDLNPDEVVALGAALQAHALTAGSDTLLLDVTPLSLGIETMGGIVEKVIHRNTPIPVSMAQEFTTFKEGQTAMDIHVVQGEREMVADCRSLAKFTLKGIPSMVAGAARIKVHFTVDADGLLTVSAKEEATGTEQRVEVKPSYGIDVDTMETMLRESMEHAKEDILQRLLSEARVEAQRTINDVEAAMKADPELLKDEEKAAIEKQIVALQTLIQSDNRDAIDAAAHHLNEITNPFAQRRMDSHIGDALQGRAVNDI